MKFKDYYQILGVNPDTESKDIKMAYRRLARKYHPDMNPDKGAEEKFKEVAEAYEVLKDPARRAEYDELRQYGGRAGAGFEPPPGWQSTSGAGARTDSFSEQEFSDFFNSLFGQRGHEFRSSQTEGDFGFRGRDLELEMPIFLEDTLTDESKQVTYHIPVYENGQVRQVKKSLNVKIPKGVMDGERIRVKGQGAAGQGSGANGDLYLHIRLVPHPLFDVQGHNLLITVPLTPWEAALGAKVTIPTLKGKINLTIAPNAQSGQKLRIKGKGLPSKTGTGDLYAILKVVMPPTVNDDAKKLWTKLSETADFDPRAEWSNA
ncbi:MAG: curved DNA-binding protein [Pseudomonadales bacterium]|nr:curved DNA-binding protein [Pseudomonadales bacterium]